MEQLSTIYTVNVEVEDSYDVRQSALGASLLVQKNDLNAVRHIFRACAYVDGPAEVQAGANAHPALGEIGHRDSSELGRRSGHSTHWSMACDFLGIWGTYCHRNPRRYVAHLVYESLRLLGKYALW